jgi:uncharacterized protein (DUF2235 family)
VDYAGDDKTKGERYGWDWQTILARAVDDAVKEWKPKMQIDIFGFSRGGALANEVARAIWKRNNQITINFLGMFDPVYSFEYPGVGSIMVQQVMPNCNCVKTSLPPNVVNVAVYYAAHETRSFFSATMFTLTSPVTKKVSYINAPGGHGDVGGHWMNNRTGRQ